MSTNLAWRKRCSKELCAHVDSLEEAAEHTLAYNLSDLGDTYLDIRRQFDKEFQGDLELDAVLSQSTKDLIQVTAPLLRNKTEEVLRGLASGRWKLDRVEIIRHFGTDCVEARRFLEALRNFALTSTIPFKEAFSLIQTQQTARRSGQKTFKGVSREKLWTPNDVVQARKALDMAGAAKTSTAATRNSTQDDDSEALLDEDTIVRNTPYVLRCAINTRNTHKRTRKRVAPSRGNWDPVGLIPYTCIDHQSIRSLVKVLLMVTSC